MRLYSFKLWNYTKIVGGSWLLNSASETDCKLVVVFLKIVLSIVAHILK